MLLAAALSGTGAAVGVAVGPAVASFVVPVAGLDTWLPLPGGGIELVLATGLVATTGADPGGRRRRPPLSPLQLLGHRR